MLTSKLIIMSILLSSSLLFAEEDDKPSCEEIYNTCLEICEVNQMGISVCYNLCDDNYEKCFEMPESIQKNNSD